MDDIVEYITGRWPNLKTRAGTRELRRRIRAVRREERAADFPRTPEQLEFDILVRVTQLYEIEFGASEMQTEKTETSQTKFSYKDYMKDKQKTTSTAKVSLEKCEKEKVTKI